MARTCHKLGIYWVQQEGTNSLSETGGKGYRTKQTAWISQMEGTKASKRKCQITS
jgi:hypothetical protein